MRTKIKISFVLVLFIAYSCSSDSDGLKNDAMGMESLSGLEFTQSERDSVLESLTRFKAQYDSLRTIQISNDIPLPLYFNPLINGQEIPKGREKYLFQEFPTKRPDHIEDCAFYTIGQLAHLIRTRQISSLELTEMYLSRLERFGTQLECVVTVTKELAIEQAKRADEAIKNGKYLGPLHGIPYGAKDLLAVEGYKLSLIHI